VLWSFMDFYICYQHKQREIDNACLIKTELERRGYSVKIIYVSAVHRLVGLSAGPNSVVVMPWMYDDININTALKIFGRKTSKIVNLRSEQISSEVNLESGFEFPKGQATEVYNICWGNKTKQRLLDRGIKEKYLLLTGAIGTDFDRAIFDGIYYSRYQLSQKYNLNPDKKWLLFISSFSYSGWSYQDLQKEMDRTALDLSDFYKLSLESKKHILQWLERFSKENPDVELIYRPHPAEKHDSDILSMAKVKNNFHVISECSINQWIRVCNNINTWYSTSIIDSYFLNKYCAILRPVSIPEPIDVEIMVGATFVTTYDEFLKVNTKSDNIFPIKKEIMSDFYSFDPQTPSYIRICNELEKIYKNEESKHYYSINTTCYHYSRSNGIIYLMFYYLCHYFKISNLFPFKNATLKSLERNAYRVSQYIKEFCSKLNDLLPKNNK